MAAVIELTGLTKRYGATIGIQQLDLRVEAGEVFGFLGPNGAGKTTTIRCMVGLLSPTAGMARVLGLDPIADHARLTPQLGYLPGELRRYGELTGAQHLALLGELQGRPTPRREELCQRLELTGRDLGRPVAEYSHGMRQKVGLVQALQHDPEVVVQPLWFQVAALLPTGQVHHALGCDRPRIPDSSSSTSSSKSWSSGRRPTSGRRQPGAAAGGH